MSWFKKPSTTGGICYLICVGMTVAGLAVAVAGRWRVGVAVMGAGFIFAFVMRMVLPDEQAGMLRVRRRLFDMLVLAVCGGLFVALSVVIKNRP